LQGETEDETMRLVIFGSLLFVAVLVLVTRGIYGAP